MLKTGRNNRPLKTSTPDGHAAVPVDGQAVVAAAAARLDIPEVEVVQLAYRWWHGATLPPRRLDQVFARYMFNGQAPPWLRHYAREVLRCEPGDQDSRRRLGLEESASGVARARHGWLVIPSTIAAMMAIVALCIGAAHSQPATDATSGQPAPLSCTAGGPGLATIEALAYAFAGRRPPPCPTASPGEDDGRSASRGPG